MLLYNSTVSGNCYKVRLLLAHLGIDVRAPRARRRRPVEPARGARRPQPRPAGADPRARRRAPARGVRRDPLVLRRGDAVRAGRPLRARPGAAVDVLRAVHARARDRRRPVPGRVLGRAREARRPDRGADEAGLPRARRDGAAPRRRRAVPRRRALTLADIALYAYTHVAHEGGFDLAGYPAIRAWLERVAAEPGHVTIDA